MKPYSQLGVLRVRIRVRLRTLNLEALGPLINFRSSSALAACIEAADALASEYDELRGTISFRSTMNFRSTITLKVRSTLEVR